MYSYLPVLYTLVVLPMMFCISRCLCTKDVPCNWAPHWSHVTVKEFLRWITSLISYADGMYRKVNIEVCPFTLLHTNWTIKCRNLTLENHEGNIPPNLSYHNTTNLIPCHLYIYGSHTIHICDSKICRHIWIRVSKSALTSLTDCSLQLTLPVPHMNDSISFMA